MKLKTVVPPIDNNRSQQWSGMYVFSREAKDHIPRCGTRWLTVGSLSLLQNLPSRASLAFNNCLAQNTGSGVCDFGGETGGGGSRRKRERSRRKADDMGLLKLFVTASVPVMKVLLVTGVGSFLATGQVGILCHEARKHLNNVVFYVFNPALVSTNLSRTITMESLVLLWFMPINILLTFIIGFAFGWVVIQITNAPSHLKGLVLGCCAAGNLGNMLLIIVPAICKERGSPFGASDVCTTYGLAYASLSMALYKSTTLLYNIVRISAGASEGKANAYSDTQEQQIIQETEKLVPQNCLDRTLPIEHTYLPGDECVLILSASEIPQNELKIGAIFLWSFVYNIVRISAGASEGKANAYSDTQEQQIIQETEKLIGAIFLWSFVYNIVRISAGASEGKANAYSDTQEQQIIQETEKLVPQNCLDRTLPIEHTYLPGDECVLILSASEIPQNELKVSFSDKARQLLSNILKIIDLKKLFAPSTVGVIIGFIIGVVPQIRKAVIGETAPLRVIQESADLLGEGAIPTLTLIMGGNLIKGLRGSGIRFSLILGVVIVRYIMLPLVGILVVKGAINLGLLHQDPLYHFILLLQYALPPAMNIGTITQLFGAGESECSVIFLWTYSLASVSLTLWSTYFMWLVSTN
ncbi:hypothetical protein C4D60_Mb03t03430 [Musa balbisiana]|uniref:Auxin efflux carrier family protein n=1 Tax=Musa balbisiana TaxID=52838 RepID=A0A4S8J782_MUSBA|nr:hypothetical protein C4D60_Mb03t03430 [Musa balbisiana]